MAGRREIVGSGVVKLEVDKAGAKAALKAFEKDVSSSMKRAGAQEAHPSVDLQTRALDRKILETKAKLAELDAQEANPKVDLDDKKYKKDKEQLERDLKHWKDQKIIWDFNVSGLKEARRQLKEAEKEYKRVQQEERNFARMQMQAQRDMEKAFNDRVKAERDYAKMQSQAHRDMSRDFAERERMERDLARTQMQAQRDMERAFKGRTDAERDYAKMQMKAQEDMRRAFDDRAEAERRFARMQMQAGKDMERDFDNRERAVRDYARMQDQARRAMEADFESRERKMRDLARMQMQARRDMEREFRQREQAILQRKQERDGIARMTMEYHKLLATVDEYDDKIRRARRTQGQHAAFALEYERDAARKSIRDLEDQIRKQGGTIRIPVEPDTTRLRGRLRDSWRSLDRDSSVFSRSLRLSARTVADELDHARMKFRDFGDSIRETRVDLGIFSIRMSHLLKGLQFLGPVIVDVVGALGPLISVLGSGILGFGALGTAVIGGALPALAGFLGILVPTGKELVEAVGAMNEAEKAIKKYGKGSEEAKEAQEDMQDALKGMGPETARAARGIMKLKNRWTDLTAPAQASLMRTIGDTIGYANNNLDMFARNTNTVTKTFETGIRSWLRGLDSVEGRTILGDMMTNFNASITPVLNGLGSLMTYLGRVGQVASSFLPGLAGQFEDWAQGVADGAKNTNELRKGVERAIDSLRAVGRFAMAGGRFLKAFFSAGVDQGQSFLQTITDILKRWTEWAESAEGRKSIQDFFGRAVNGAKAFMSVLTPLVELIFKWSDALSPVTTQIMKVVGAIANLIGNFLEVMVLGNAFSAAAVTWFGGRIIGMIGKFASKVRGAAAAMGLLSAASMGGGITGGFIGGGRRKGGMVGFGREVEKLGKSSGVASGAIGGLLGNIGKLWKSPIGKLKIVGGVTALGTAALGVAEKFGGIIKRNNELNDTLYQGSTRMEEFGKKSGGVFDAIGRGIESVGYHFENLPFVRSVGPALDKAGEWLLGGSLDIAAETKSVGEHWQYAQNYAGQFGQALQEVSTLMAQQASRTLMVKNAQEAYNQTVKEYGKGSVEAKAAAESLRNASIGQYYAQMQQKSALSDVTRAQKDYGRQLEMTRYNMGLAMEQAKGSDDTESLKRLQESYELLNQDIRENSTQVQINGKRVRENMLPLADQAISAIAKLRTQVGKHNQSKLSEVALKFPDPQKTHRAMNAIQRAIDAGMKPRKAMNVILNANSAKKGIQELSRLLERASRRRSIQVDTRAIDRASTKLQKFIGIKLTPKEMRLALRGDKEVLGKISKISGLKPKEIKQLIRAEVRKAEQDIKKVEGQKITPKKAEVSAPGAPEAMVQLFGVKAAADAIPRTVPVHVSITADKMPSIPRGGRAAGGFAPGFAAGGSTGAGPNVDRMERAAERAAQSQTRDIRGGGRVSRPTYLTGEENRPEIIISTNPRYRERNLGLLQTAARALNAREMVRTDGLPRDAIVSAAVGFAGVTKGVQRDRRIGLPKLGATARPVSGTKSFLSSQKKKRNGKRYKKKSKKWKIYNAQNSWSKRVGGLLKSQEHWEQEASIRERMVDEPESFLKVVGKTEDGEDDVYAIDTAAQEKYRDQIRRLREAQNMLVQITQQLVVEIPLAIQAIGRAIRQRKSNIDVLKGRLKDWKGRVSGWEKTYNKTEDKDRKSNLKNKIASGKKKISTWEKQLTRETGARDSLQSERGELGEARVQSGFDLRNYTLDVEESNTDIGNVGPTSQKQLEDANRQPGDGSGTGGLSIGEQRAAAAGEMRGALAQYGSQAQQGGAAAVAGAMMGGGFGGAAGGGGLGSAAAAMAGGVSGGGFGGIAGTGGGLGSAVSGGAMASSMMGPGSGGGGFGAMAAGGGAAQSAGAGDKVTTVNVTNNFQEPPADPHTWSSGLEFELGTI